jgi:hypothetical protein
MNRNNRTDHLASNSGIFYGTSEYINVIRSAMRNGNLGYTTMITSLRDRLDHIAAREYGDARLWWVISAASDIGWGLQVPHGTRLKIPTDLEKIKSLVG